MTARKRFLVVTADPARAQALASLLSGAGGKPAAAAGEAEALAELSRAPCAAVFIDADLPGRAGLSLCRRLRGLLPAGACALVLFGSPRGEAAVVRGLDEGADDYWAYPLNAPLCLGYLRAILRRVSALGSAGGALKDGELEADPARREARLAGKPLSLRSKEFDLLYLLLKRKGEVLSREFLMETAWGREYFGTTRTIDFHVSRLRRKLGRLGARLEAVAKTGYRYAAE